MTIDIILNSVKLNALLDTGSDISVGSNNIFQDKKCMNSLGISDYTSVLSVGGQVSPILGVSVNNISISDFQMKVILHVLENCFGKLI